MALHKLPRGLQFIGALSSLGQTLGYHVERENPVEPRRRRAASVDLAWFSDSGQDYPLMVFEVESRVTNAATNNPVKVLGPPNERVEKPLFFFHVFMTGKRNATRIEALRGAFGSHNYRAYTLADDGLVPLVLDILSQHRRLHRKLDLLAVLKTLRSDPWTDLPLATLLTHLEDLAFEANFLPTYAALALEQTDFLPHFLRLLAGLDISLPPRRVSSKYESYLGSQWGEPIHIGLLALNRSGEQDYLQRLRHWQEHAAPMSMIGPHFGLSREYDDFVLGLAPAFVAFLAALTYKVQGSAEYLLAQLRLILTSLNGAPAATSFPTALWALHVASAANEISQFEELRTFLNDRGGVPADLLYQPPSSVAFFPEVDPGWKAQIMDEPSTVPLLQDFRRKLRPYYSRVGDLDRELTAFALEVLVDDDALRDWAGPIALYLHAPSGLTTTSAKVSTRRGKDTGGLARTAK